MIWKAAGCAAALCAFGSVVLAERCLNMVVRPVRRTAAQARASELEIGFSEGIEAYEHAWERRAFSLDCTDAVLSGECIVNPACAGKRARAVIVCHGHTMNRYASLKYAEIFYRAGFHVIVYDERYFGESTGRFCTLGQNEARDLARVIRYARGVFGEDCLIGLHGESMGAATALLVLAYETPDFVVADCPFADSELLFRQWIEKNLHLPPSLLLPVLEFLARTRYHYIVKDVSPIRAVEASDVPICFMHGREDKLIPCAHSEAMYRKRRNPASELHLFDGADHAQSCRSDRAGYERMMLDFLRRCGALEPEREG